MNNQHDWKSFVAIGLMLMFIAFGIGGCLYMINVSEGVRAEKVSK